jgi:hypothetical protein
MATPSIADKAKRRAGLVYQAAIRDVLDGEHLPAAYFTALEGSQS